MNSDLDLEWARSALATCTIGHTIQYHPSVGSTMRLAHEACQNCSVPSGLVIMTEKQTQGRGRLNRSWETPHGKALLVSLVLGADLLPTPISQLPILVAVAARRGIIAAEPALADKIMLKWPNDLLGGPDAQKVAGILIETSFNATDIHYAVVGIGINVNQDPNELTTVPSGTISPTSLKLLQGEAADRTRLLIAMCQSLASLIDQLAPQPGLLVGQNQPRPAQVSNLAQKSDSDDDSGHVGVDVDLWQEWRNHLHTIGQTVTVTEVTLASQSAGESAEKNAEKNAEEGPTRDNSFTGVAVDVTKDGYLVVQDAHGERRTFGSGEVTLRSSLNQ